MSQQKTTIGNFPVTVFSLAFSVFVFFALTAFQSFKVGFHEEDPKPVPYLNIFIRDMVEYRRVKYGFPQNLNEMNETIWKKQTRSGWIAHPQGFAIKSNYAYYYHPISSRKATLWAIPVGKERLEGSSYFMVFEDNQVRYWKGPALALDDAESSVKETAPTFSRLSALGMAEQKPIPISAR